MSPLRYFYEAIEGLGPGSLGLGYCGSFFTRPKTKRAIIETYPVRHFVSIWLAFEQGELGNVNWYPGAGAPAGALTEVRSDMTPLSRILESGRFHPGSPRHLKGVA